MGVLKALGVVILIGIGVSFLSPTPVTASASATEARTSFAQANTWDGVWGRRDGMMITVRGNAVQYAWQGQAWPIQNLRMDQGNLRFQLGNGRDIWLQMNRDGTANFRSQLPGQQAFTGKIWRQR